MRKTLLLTLTALLMFTSFSCKKDSDDNTILPATSGFSAKVDGTTWTATIFLALRSTTANDIEITSTSGVASEQMDLIIKGSGTGTYPIGVNNVGAAYIGGKTFTSVLSLVPAGTIVITKYDESAKLISGTFFFDAADQLGVVYHVTGGTFTNVPLTIE